MNLRNVCVYLCAAILLSSASFASAQRSVWPPCPQHPSLRSTLSGTISDPTGAYLSSASISIGCAGHVHSLRTDAKGSFAISLPQGIYLMKASAPGFTAIETTIHLNASQSTLPLKLSVGPNTSHVEVRAVQGYVATNSFTASKTDTSLLETPQSISVIPRTMLDAQAPQTLNEALRYAGGIDAEVEGATSSFWTSNSMRVRGFSPSVFEDGVSADNTGNDLLDPYFYQRIELLEGPASTLYGQGSPAGIVNVETKRPTSQPAGEVQLGGGTYGRAQLNFDLSGPLFTPHLLYRATGVFFNEGSQTWFVHSRRRAFAPAFTWLPDNRTSLTLLSNYTYNPEIGPYAPLPAIGTAVASPYGRIATSVFTGDPNFNLTRQSFLQVADLFNRDMGHGWQLGQIFRFSGSKNNAHMLWPIGLMADQETLRRYSFIRHVRFNSTLSDNHVTKTWKAGPTQNILLAGVNYSRFDELWHYGSNLKNVPSINLFHPVYYQQIPTPSENTQLKTLNQQTGIYFQDQTALKRLRLLFTGRQDWLSLHKASGIVGGTTKTTHFSPSKFTFRTGAVYLLGKGFAPYLSYATSFQPNTAVASNGSLLQPMTGKQYEGGLKYQPNRRNILITAAAYDLKEQHVGVTDPSNSSFSIAIGEIESKGFELQGRAGLTHHLNLTSSYTFTLSRYTKTPLRATGIDGVSRAIKGNYQFGIPKNMANLFLDYSLPILKGSGVSAGSRFVGSSYGDSVNSFLVHGATLFDAAVHYDLPVEAGWLHGVRLQMNGSNLGNRTYVASCSSSTSCYYGMKRTAFGTMSYRW